MACPECQAELLQKLNTVAGLPVDTVPPGPMPGTPPVVPPPGSGGGGRAIDKVAEGIRGLPAPKTKGLIPAPNSVGGLDKKQVKLLRDFTSDPVLIETFVNMLTQTAGAVQQDLAPQLGGGVPSTGQSGIPNDQVPPPALEQRLFG